MNMRRRNSIPLLITALAASLAACSSMREAMEGHQNAVARAAGYSLSIRTAAEFAAASVPQASTPGPRVIDSVAELWTSCVLLATELTSPNGFSDVDVGPMVRGKVAQAMIRKLYDDIVAANVDSSDAAMRAAYRRDQPFTHVEASHIFIAVSGAGQAEIDSLRRFAEAIRQRATGGEDFGRLAREYSQDPTSAHQGGYLGWVGREHFLATLDAVLLEMRPGEVSETVRSSLGYHIFKVTDRESPDFETAREVYRLMYLSLRIDEIETVFLDSLIETSGLRLAPGAVGLVQRLARSPGLEQLSVASRAAVLARYRGGALTVGDWAEAVSLGGKPAQRLYTVPDSVALHDFLMQMAQDHLLATVASELGYNIADDEYNGYVEAARRDLQTAARLAGFQRPILAGDEEAMPSAIERAVWNMIRNPAGGLTLDRVSLALRQNQTHQLYTDRFPVVVDQVSAIRQERSQ
jgi:parvulin-like peptidyl-prolyl isomerase